MTGPTLFRQFSVGTSGELTPEALEAFARPTATALQALTDELKPRLEAIDRLQVAMWGAQGGLRSAEAMRAGPARTRAISQAQTRLRTATTTFERAARALETDIDARLERAAPNARAIIDRVHNEAVADRRALVGGADREVDAWLGKSGVRRWLYDTFVPEVVSDNHNAAFQTQMREADASANMYRDLARNWSRLRPTGTDRLRSDPILDESE